MLFDEVYIFPKIKLNLSRRHAIAYRLLKARDHGNSRSPPDTITPLSQDIENTNQLPGINEIYQVIIN